MITYIKIRNALQSKTFVWVQTDEENASSKRKTFQKNRNIFLKLALISQKIKMVDQIYEPIDFYNI